MREEGFFFLSFFPSEVLSTRPPRLTLLYIYAAGLLTCSPSPNSLPSLFLRRPVAKIRPAGTLGTYSCGTVPELHRIPLTAFSGCKGMQKSSKMPFPSLFFVVLLEKSTLFDADISKMCTFASVYFQQKRRWIKDCLLFRISHV